MHGRSNCHLVWCGACSCTFLPNHVPSGNRYHPQHTHLQAFQILPYHQLMQLSQKSTAKQITIRWSSMHKFWFDIYVLCITCIKQMNIWKILNFSIPIFHLQNCSPVQYNASNTTTYTECYCVSQKQLNIRKRCTIWQETFIWNILF